MLRQRILTASILAAGALLAIFLLPAAIVAGFAALVGFAAGVEWTGLARRQAGGPGRWIYGSALAGGVLFCWQVFESSVLAVGVVTLFWMALLAWVGKLVIFREPGRIKPSLALGAMTLAPALGLVPYLHGRPGYGTALLVTVLMVIWSADIGAYFGGRRFGKSLFAPAISPGKTWAGAFIGFSVSVLAGWGTAYVFSIPVDPPWLLWTALSVTAVGGILADLFESILKRSVGKKDTSALLPGHGGVLDRIDSMLGAVPLFAGLSIFF